MLIAKIKNDHAPRCNSPLDKISGYHLLWQWSPTRFHVRRELCINKLRKEKCADKGFSSANTARFGTSALGGTVLSCGKSRPRYTYPCTISISMVPVQVLGRPISRSCKTFINNPTLNRGGCFVSWLHTVTERIQTVCLTIKGGRNDDDDEPFEAPLLVSSS